MHSIAGACVSVPRRQLPSTFVSEDEASGDAHKELQKENARWMPDLQTAHRALLLSREALQGEQVPCAVLSKYQAKASATKSCATVNIVDSAKPYNGLTIIFHFSLQEQQFNRRRAAAMNIRMQAMSQSTTTVPTQVAAGGSKEEMSPGSISPAQGMGGMGSPHHAGIGMKPGTQKPPAAVLQVVKQVRRWMKVEKSLSHSNLSNRFKLKLPDNNHT